MAYYPVNLDLRGRRCLVAGGGEVACRKVDALLEFQAKVVLISPEIVPPLKQLVEQGVIEYIKGKYHPACLDDAFLVFAATGDKETNRRIAEDAEKKGVPVNVADAPELCTFTVPAVVHRGDLTISISTGGKSPALSRSVRKELEEKYGDEMRQLTRFLGEVREYLISRISDAETRKKILSCLGETRTAEFYRRGEGKMLEEAVWCYIKEMESSEE